PPTIFINVDLPAPFSPSSAQTSPARSVKSTPSSARTPGKDRVMHSSARTESIAHEYGAARGSPAIACPWTDLDWPFGGLIGFPQTRTMEPVDKVAIPK